MTTFTEKSVMLRIQDALANLHKHSGAMPAIGRGWTLLRLWITGLFIMLLAGCGGSGSPSSTPVGVPGAPSAVTVTAGDNATTISWNAVAGATSYNVYRSTTEGGRAAKIGASTTTSYVDSTAANGTTYYYRVTADNAAGEGSASTQSPGVTPAVPVAVPVAPTGLSATPGDAQVTLQWTAVAGASSYNVYRSTSSGSQGSKIGSSSTAQYSDTAASNGITYYYAVTADNAVGEGPASAQSSGVTPSVPATAPSAPTGINAVAGNNQVAVSWTAVAGATSYNVYRSTSAAAQGSKVGSSATTAYNDATAANGTTYYYVVTASNAVGEGPASAPSSGATPAVPVNAPTAPTAVNVVAGNALVTVSWAASPTATSYKIYRSTSQGSQGSLLGSSSTTSYSDTAVVNGTTYYYVVTAANSAGESPASMQSASATPQVPLTAPSAPTGVNAAAGNAQVAVSWTAAARATSYNVYRSTSQGAQGTKIGASATLSYTDMTSVNGTTYYYTITAVNAAGESPASMQSSGAMPAVPLTVPAAPTAVNVAAGNALVTVTWTASPTATSYKIYRSTTQATQGSLIGTSSTTSYSDTTAVNGTTYYYVVTAVNAAGEGSPSTQSAGATPVAPPTVPAAPAGVSATDGVGQVTVSWAAVSGATSYKVYRSTTQGVRGTLIGSTSSTSLADSTVVENTTYYFVVTASNVAGEGAASAAVSVTHTTTWSSAKIGGGGYVTGLVFHPASANLLYARTDVGGAYRWNEAAASWVSITDTFGASESFHHGVESIALDPNNDQLVYMVTGMYASTDATARLYISSDRGGHWTHVDLPFSAGGNNIGRAIGERLMVDPNKPSTMYYGSRTAGLWKSADSGSTWAQVTSLSSAKMTADQFNAAGGQAKGVELVVYDTGTKGTGTATATLYAAIAPDYVSVAGLGSNLYKSTNGGTSWAAVSTPVSGYHIPHMVRAADGMFYVLFTQGAGPGDPGPARLYKFDGTNWTLLNSNNFAGYGGLSVFGSGSTARIALGVSGTWGNFSGQQVVQLSDDGGQTWREIAATMPHTPASDGFSGWIDDVEIDPFNRNRVLHVFGGGVWETRNASSSTPSWNFAVERLEETCALAFATPPAGAPYTLLNSSGDIGLWVHTDLTKTPTLTPYNGWSNGNSMDMAWSDSNYIAAAGVINSASAHTGTGFWSGDGGKTWATFVALPSGAADNTHHASNIAVTARNNAVWAPADSVPSYTTDNGATWTATNLPALTAISGVPRSYRVVADRKNPNKVYAYDSGGAWWGTAGKVYVSTDGGHNFTLSQGSVSANLRANSFNATSMAVNPYVEGDLWLADGNTVYHSVDSGATWTKLNNFASIWGGRETWQWPDVQGASVVALGKAKPGATYSAAVYVVGVINGVWGVYRSDDAGVTWARFNDDAHQFAGPNVMAADHNVYGRIYLGGSCRGVVYSN
jgi:fibronectin type 3 domain-containing protein